MVIKNLRLELGQEKDSLLRHLDKIIGECLLLAIHQLSSLSAVLDQVKNFGQNEVHVREKTCLILGVYFEQKFHDRHRLDVDHLVDHLKD